MAYGYDKRDETGNLSINVGPGTGSAGFRVTDPVPQAQASANYGILSEMETFVGASGSVTSNDETFICKTGTTIGGYGVIRTNRSCSPPPRAASDLRVGCCPRLRQRGAPVPAVRRSV